LRNLQKLRHTRIASPVEKPALEVDDQQRVSRRERFIWIRRGKRLATLAVIGAIGWGVLSLAAGLRRTSDALVEVNTLRVTAPGPVRIAEVFVQANQPCQLGQPIARIEPVQPHPERGRLMAQVEIRRARLAWFDGGGEVEELGRTLRTDLVAEAHRQMRLAESEQALGHARVESLNHERARTVSELREESQRRHYQVSALTERRGLASAFVSEADANLNLANFDANAAERLVHSGIVPEREVRSTRSLKNAASSSVEALVASTQVLERELEAAQASAESFDGRIPTTIAHLDARMKEALSELQVAEERKLLWSDMRDHHQNLDTNALEDVESLRQLRRRVLESEVAEAEAQLAVFDFEQGARTIHAQVDGRVDQVFVSVGDVLEQDARIAEYFDPRTLRVVTYVTPAVLSQLEVGLACRLKLGTIQDPLEGHITTIGSTWIPCPPTLPRRISEAVDLRIPVEVTCAIMDRVDHLSPNMRLKVTFDWPGWENLRRRIFGD